MNRSLIRNITGLVGSFEKKCLWHQGFSKSVATDNWTAEQIRNYQDKKLVEIVRDAAKNIPFYKKLYSDAGVDIGSFCGTRDMHLLPPVDKKVLVENKEQLIRPGISKLSVCEHTSGGSTGTIATVVSRRGLASFESGCIYALWSRIGVKGGDRMVILRGTLIDGGKSVSKLEKRYNRLTISTYHLKDNNVKKVIRLIDDFKPDWLHVYPSAACLLANIMRNNGGFLSCEPKGVLCGSEKLYPWQIGLFKEMFAKKIYSHYGHGEYVLLGGWCHGSDSFHFLPNHGYLELLDNNQEVINEPGITGEITGTGYVNTVMPLIRYRTADFGQWDKPGACLACGREHQRLASIEGRIQEYLILADGTKFPVTNINALHGRFFSYIYRFQFRQSFPGKAELRFLPAGEMTDEKFGEIKRAFTDLQNVGLDIDFKIVDDIALTSRGKERIVVKSGKLADD